MLPLNTIIEGDCLMSLRLIDGKSVDCCVTSPPYFGLRDYGIDGQIGQEESPESYTHKLLEIFREVSRILKDDGTLWLNLGDSYYNYRPGKGQSLVKQSISSTKQDLPDIFHKRGKKLEGLKEKDLIGIPWHVAFALQNDGWYLRSDIIWSKNNCMPESVIDRPTRSHEYIFLMAKSKNYFYDTEAIKEKSIYFGIAGMDDSGYKDSKKYNGKNATDKQCGHARPHVGFNEGWDNMTKKEQTSGYRNKRDVWNVATSNFRDLHFATFPEKLIEPCILAGCKTGGIVLDPFIGSGTTALVALKHGRNFIGCELNPEYIRISEERISAEKAQIKLF